MAAFLFAEEGPLAGLIIRLEEGEEWIIGRDPDVSFQVLEDPMVSRRHVLCRLAPEGYSIENLSAVNPAHINGKPIAEPALMHEGDLIQIGNTFFRFTMTDPAAAFQPPKEPPAEPRKKEISSPESPPFYEEEGFEPLAVSAEEEARFFIKVISGPNNGAEFPLQKGHTYIIGKDPSTCDILFQDLSVSREHAKITIDEGGEATIEDLSSRNGVFVNSSRIEGAVILKSQDLIALGTTSFLIIDREQAQETIYSPPPIKEVEERIIEEVTPEKEKEKAMKNWRETIIPFRHLALALLFILFLFIGIGGIFSLFKSKTIIVEKKDETNEIRDVLKSFPAVEFSFNPNNGKVFLLGHVLTEIEHQEMVYLLKTLPFIDTIEDNVLIDELIWENMNALLIKNPTWRSVSMTGAKPGRFIIRGYLQTQEDMAALMDFVNLNFAFTDKLENQIAVEQTLQTQIQSLLVDKGFVNVTFQLANGELILAGRVNADSERDFERSLEEIKDIKGIRMVKNFVIFTTASTTRIDLSNTYKVTGNSKFGNISQFVVINGKILSTGDQIDGMNITAIEPNTILLEKDGLKYKIDYNQQ